MHGNYSGRAEGLCAGSVMAKGVPAHRLCAALLDASPHPVVMLDRRSGCVLANRHWQHCHGVLPRPGLRGLLAVLPASWRRPLHGLMRAMDGRGQTVVETIRWPGLDGQPWRLQLQLNYRAGEPVAWLLECQRVEAGSHDGRLLPQVQLQASMLDAALDCIKVISLDGRLRHMNRAGCLALGLAPESAQFGMPWLELLPATVRSQGRRALARAGSGKAARFSGRSVVDGQAVQYWDNRLSPMYDGAGQVVSILCVSRNITAQREAEQRLRLQAHSDALTGLCNRGAFLQRLRQMIGQCRRQGRVLGLLLIDLDHFKHTNDTLGHAAGDHLLRVLARRMAAAIGPQGVVTRLGGDEFAVLLPDVAGVAELEAMAGQVRQLAQQPVHYAGQPINGGMSIGCARYPDDGSDAAQLLRAADTALNDLKANGRGGVRAYCARLLEAAEQAAGQLRLARQIVHEAAVLPYYQPKVRLSDGVQVGFEALLRWRLRNGQHQVASCQMDQAFADYELAVGLAEQMHGKVLADMAGWLASGLSVLPVALNASPVEFLRDDFAERLLARAQAHGVPPWLLEVEITEQVLADRGAAFVVRALHKLKDAGVRIALDDFGTGHSSLAHLRDYPIHCLKIDRSFISRMEAEPAIRAIIHAVVTLGPGLQIDLVAEGVENIRQRELLLAAGCRLGQGFLYAPALPAAAAAMRLRQPLQAVNG